MTMMIRNITLTAVSVLAISAGMAPSEVAETHMEDVAFAHEGPFGAFDQMQLQRGLQVYTEVCAACHGLKFVPIRTLADAGGPALPEDQVRAYATQFSVTDKETGEDRDGLPTDFFPKSGVANAPDLSLMAKARAGFHGPYGTGINPIPAPLITASLRMSASLKSSRGLSLIVTVSEPRSSFQSTDCFPPKLSMTEIFDRSAG